MLTELLHRCSATYGPDFEVGKDMNISTIKFAVEDGYRTFKPLTCAIL
jgi:hypothetical protein